MKGLIIVTSEIALATLLDLHKTKKCSVGLANGLFVDKNNTTPLIMCPSIKKEKSFMCAKLRYYLSETKKLPSFLNDE